MRGGKDEEKMMSRMFPRLHVNDSDKGGPRAPPRNKMALYEQLSIPSQRFNSGSSSTMPLLPTNNGNLVPSVSACHGGTYERSHQTVFSDSIPKKHPPYALGGVKSSSMIASEDYRTLNATGDQCLRLPRPLLSSPKGSSIRLGNFSSFKNFLSRTIGDDSDFRVPSSSLAGAALHRIESQQIKDCEKQPELKLVSSMQLQHACEKQNKGSSNLVSRTTVQTQTQSNVEVCHTFQCPAEKSVSVSSMRGKRSFDATLGPLVKVMSTGSLKRAHPLPSQICRNNSLDGFKSLDYIKEPPKQAFSAMKDMEVPKDKIFVDNTSELSNKTASSVRIKSCSKPSLRNDDSFCVNGNPDNKGFGSSPARDVERCNGVSETSTTKSIAALGITPDDVVRVIGDKQFWKARRAISNQQRVFALQVFELHRLIKVQKLIAGSPNMLLESKLYPGKASLEVSPSENLTSEHLLEKQMMVVQPKDHYPKPHSGKGFPIKNLVGKLPFASVPNQTSTRHTSQRSNNEPHTEIALPAHVPSNNVPSPLCFPSSGNHWLVPVMSPSEGLVYKPYAGSCPPPGGFMAPLYGSCGPMSLTLGSGEFLSTTYSLPASHQPGIGVPPGCTAIGRTYFPPYGMPLMNPSFSGSAVKQMSPFGGTVAKDIKFLVGDMTFPNQSSCNKSSQTSRVISCCSGKFEASKGSEKQGSTASSPLDRAKADVLPLFPVEPTVQLSDRNDEHNEHPVGVIKVVPHNPRSAKESAAWIFRSIQEERKQ